MTFRLERFTFGLHTVSMQANRNFSSSPLSSGYALPTSQGQFLADRISRSGSKSVRLSRPEGPLLKAQAEGLGIHKQDARPCKGRSTDIVRYLICFRRMASASSHCERAFQARETRLAFPLAFSQGCKNEPFRLANQG